MEQGHLTFVTSFRCGQRCFALRVSDAFLGTGGSYGSIVFSVVVVLLGMYIVLALFVAILLEGFSDQDDDKFDMEDQVETVWLSGLRVRCVECHAWALVLVAFRVLLTRFSCLLVCSCVHTSGAVTVAD